MQPLSDGQMQEQQTKAEILAGIQRALEDLKAGRVSTVEDLWNDIDA
jgi:predicted transcriptional regulator